MNTPLEELSMINLCIEYFWYTTKTKDTAKGNWDCFSKGLINATALSGYVALPSTAVFRFSISRYRLGPSTLNI